MKSQRGGFVMGLIVGLLVGLALALGVALYVTKVPVPFVNKVPQRSPEQDAAEAEKNKNWDPNSPLYGKNPARPNAVPPAASTVAPGQAPIMAAPAMAAPASELPPRAPDVATARPVAPPPPTPPVSTHSGTDPFMYFVQVGAYSRPEDAEAQRARLAMLGMAAKVTERDQSGRTVYRVSVGPFDHKDDADSARDRLVSSGMESSLVRVQR